MAALSLGRSSVWAVRSCESVSERTMACGTSRCLNADSRQNGDGSTLCMNCHFRSMGRRQSAQGSRWLPPLSMSVSRGYPPTEPNERNTARLPAQRWRYLREM